ncbi:efflux RND transporter permease subunit [Alkalilimnicola ehrlichii]|uniref:efflux RND transporter permease subunit n=1 Tax=Alkalilimnicola ehrlichii TaxID=351052 RepID=UPI003BA28BBF
MIRWFAAHPTAANLVLVILVAVGLFAAPTLQRETFPDYRPGEVSIEVAYRGASAADVEDNICRRLHDAVKGVEHLDEFVCTAQDNRASATASMAPRGTMARFLGDIDTEVKAITDFPERADPAVVRELHRTDLVAAVAITGDLSLVDHEAYAQRLEDRLIALPGVADVITHGLSQRQWQVEVGHDALAQHGLSAIELAARVAAQNIDSPLGTLETPDREILLRFTDERHDLAGLGELVVLSDEGGGELRLSEIARLSEHREHTEEKVLMNGRRAVLLEVHKATHADALDVMEAMQGLLETERARWGEALTLTVTQDATSIVRDRLQMLVSNGLLGLILVLLVLSLFFRPRLALWAGIGLPVGFLGAFTVMALTGLSLNMITLVALLMAIGLVMDHAIVITDNISARARAGSRALEAVVEGARQVLPGVISSFLTTVVVFTPLSFLAGELGAVLQVLPVVLIAALTASLIEAFLVLPHHLRGGLDRIQSKGNSRLRQGFDRAFDRFREGVGSLADRAIRFRHGVLAGTLVILLASAGYLVGGHLGTEAMPDIDGDVLEARILMPQGTPLSRTEAVAKQVSEAMAELNERLTPEQPDGASLVRNLQVRFNHNPSAGEPGPHVATLSVDLLTAERRTVDLETLTAAWREAIGPIAGVHSLVIQEPGFGPAGTPIEVRLSGDDLDELQQASEHLKETLGTYQGVYNVLHDLRPGKPQYQFRMAEGAHGLGLTAEATARQLRAAILGELGGTLRIGAHDVEILVRHTERDRNRLDALEELTVLGPDGQRIPLAVATERKAAREWARITRVDGQRTVTVEANVNPRVANAQAIVNDLQNHWLPDFKAAHPTLAVGFEGQVARSAETGGSVRRALLIGLIGIYVILSFQFRSYVEPLLVMVAIPLAFMGALWGHVLMGYYLSMPSLVGAASLAGIVVNNAILLILFIKAHRDAGLSAVRAAGQASRDRLRAILISSGTTTAGVLPLLAESSTQADAIKPLVISVVFGLATSTVLVLFVIPALYVIFDEHRARRLRSSAEEHP